MFVDCGKSAYPKWYMTNQWTWEEIAVVVQLETFFIFTSQHEIILTNKFINNISIRWLMITVDPMTMITKILSTKSAIHPSSCRSLSSLQTYTLTIWTRWAQPSVTHEHWQKCDDMICMTQHQRRRWHSWPLLGQKKSNDTQVNKGKVGVQTRTDKTEK